MDARLLLLYLF